MNKYRRTKATALLVYKESANCNGRRRGFFLHLESTIGFYSKMLSRRTLIDLKMHLSKN